MEAFAPPPLRANCPEFPLAIEIATATAKVSRDAVSSAEIVVFPLGDRRLEDSLYARIEFVMVFSASETPIEIEPTPCCPLEIANVPPTASA